jgi:hypothetical protein
LRSSTRAATAWSFPLVADLALAQPADHCGSRSLTVERGHGHRWSEAMLTVDGLDAWRASRPLDPVRTPIGEVASAA